MEIRGRRSFFQGGLLDFLEEKGTQYLIKVKLKAWEYSLKTKSGAKCRIVLL